MPQPTASLRQSVNLELAKTNGAGPLLLAWARRTQNGLDTDERQIHALSSIDTSSPFYEALGGAELQNWIKAVLSEAPVMIDVLGLPYSGPNNGKDDDGNYFSPQTDFMDGIIDHPPVLYGHGAINGTDSNVHGKVLARWYALDGCWFKVQLLRDSSRFEQLYDAHVKGFLRASTGAVPATVEVAADGHIDRWLVGELTLVDLRDGYKPSNGYAITKAKIDNVLFESYYGDSVMETDSTIWEKIKEHFNKIREDIASWKLNSDGVSMAKCEECDQQAAEEAEEVRSLIATMKAEADLAKPKECLPCRAAVKWVGTMVKASKMGLDEALTAINRFELDASGWEDLKSEVEGRDNTVRVAIAKAKASGADISFVRNDPGDVKAQDTVDQDYMNRMRTQVNLGAK